VCVNFAREIYGSAVAASRKGGPEFFFSFDRFQIGLPRRVNPIILARKVDIGPVGVRPSAK
jgi:hypothetical protein